MSNTKSSVNSLLDELIAFRNNILSSMVSSHSLSNKKIADKLTDIINEMKSAEAQYNWNQFKIDMPSKFEAEETGMDKFYQAVEYAHNMMVYVGRQDKDCKPLDVEYVHDGFKYILDMLIKAEDSYKLGNVTWWLTFPDNWELPFKTKNEAMLFKTVIELSLERPNHPAMSKANIWMTYAGYTTREYNNYVSEHTAYKDEKKIYTASDIFASFVNEKNKDGKATSGTYTYHVEPKKDEVESPFEGDGDPVYHPKHYELMPGVEVKDILHALGNKPSELTGWQEFCRGNVIKYMLRAEEKNGQQDYEKAAVYLGWLIDDYEKGC